jgi:UTP--glucose-1-phosphate uridylyltransferase
MRSLDPVALIGNWLRAAASPSGRRVLLLTFLVDAPFAFVATYTTRLGAQAKAQHVPLGQALSQYAGARNKAALLESVQAATPPGINCIYIRQSEALGLGHAVLCAAPVVGNEPFAVILADDLIDANPPVVKQMTDVFAREGRSILGVQEVPRNQTSSYGIVRASRVSDRLESVEAIVEKPRPETAPSTLAVIGRYVLTPRIFHHLERVTPGAGGEIQLTDGIASLLTEERVLAYRFVGTRYDCGSKLGYLQATVALGRKHPEVGADFEQWLEAQSGPD